MAAKGYCTSTDVQSFLGVTLTAAQLTYADSKVETAEQVIDRYCRRGWLMGAQTNERHELQEFWRGPALIGPLILGFPGTGEFYLKYAPVTTVTSITGRMGVGATEYTLVANTDYEVVSLDQGLIRLLFPQLYDRVLVTYTPVATVPTTIRDAAAELIAWWMQPSLRPDTYGLRSVSLPDLSMQFSYGADALPPGVTSKLDLYAFKVHS